MKAPRQRRVTCTRGRRSAFYEPVSAQLSKVIRDSGSPAMLDRRRHAMAVPIAWAGRVDLALLGANFIVQPAIGEAA